MSADTPVKPSYELLEDGSVIQNIKGKPVKRAFYDEETGHLEYQDEEARLKHAAKICRVIEFDDEGTAASGNKIVSMSIKGRLEDVISPKEPPCPKPTMQLGDKTKVVVDWYFKWRPQEAYVRYGVSLDKSGEPVRVHGRRIDKVMKRDNNDLVVLDDHVYEKEDGILATRSTHLTFTRDEVVGANEPGDELSDYSS